MGVEGRLSPSWVMRTNLISVSGGRLLLAFGLSLLSGSCGSGGGSPPPPPPPPPYLSLTASPGAVTLSSAGSFSTTVKASTNTSSAPALTSAQLPSGITTTTNFPLTIPPAGTQINFQADSTLADGAYSLTLDGEAGSLTATASVSVTVNAPPQIQRVEPSRVMLGTSVITGTLAGMNFTSSSTVLFDGTAVNTVYEKPNLQFDLPSGANAPAKHTVQVSDPVYGNSNVATFEVYAPQPGPRPFVGQISQYMSEDLITNSLVPDLNGDGRADLVMVVQDSTSPLLYVPVVRYGQADGTFSAAVPLGPATPQISPGIVLAGDFNGDGHTDLILLGGNPNSPPGYQVLLNDGTGQFSSASTGLLPTSSVETAVLGDFNHDGKLDFAFGTSTTGQAFSFYFGNGDGTFTGPVPVGAVTGTVVSKAVAADFNNDGYTDIIYEIFPYNSPNQIRLLLSAPDGSYTDTQVAGLPSPTLGFAVADFNHDNIPDIFAVDGNGLGLAYLGSGNGTFKPTGSPIRASDGYLASAPYVTGDFDNDGNVDVATRIGLSGPDEIVFLWGDGKGNFTSQSVVSDHSFYLEVGDVNGDGIPDIFAGVDQGFAYPSVVLGQNGRNFPSAQFLLPNTWGKLSTGDVFGDGYTDLLVAGIDNNSTGDGSFPGTIYHYQPSGKFTAEGQAPDYQTLLVDLNGDGIADMVGLSGTNLLIWKGDGSGNFGAPVNQIPLPNAWQPIYFRDMDGDGYTDIVLPGVILYGKGNFQFDAVTTPYFENFAVGDFDGDGIPDIATPSGIMFGQGNRTFTAPTGITPLPDDPPPFPTQVVADMNGDGMDDLVLADSGFEIYLSVGRQGFVFDQALLVNGYGASITSLAVADFNGDGLLDIAAGMIGADDVVLFTNDGTGKYQVTSYAIGVYSVYSVAADLNHDGKPDLAFLGYLFTSKPPTVMVLLHK